MEVLLDKKLTYKIIGACFKVHNSMGCGFLESVYQECLEKELAKDGVKFSAQHQLDLYYDGEKLKQVFKADFICENKLIVEIKSVDKLTPTHKAQVINYLSATQLKVGLLVNFGSYPKLEYQRLIFDTARDAVENDTGSLVPWE